jgi:hypothetical protein
MTVESDGYEEAQKFLRAKLQLGLTYAGLTEIEFHVMGSIVAFDSMTVAGLAKTIRAMDGIDLSEPDCQEAVNSLIQRGYARNLTAEQIAAMRAEVAREDIPSDGFLMASNMFHPGEVDITRRGYLEYRHAFSLIYGGRHWELKDAGWVDDEHGTVKVLAADDWALLTRTGEAVLALAEEGKQILTVQAPVEIGTWRPHRLMTLPGGQCVVITYRPVPE